RAAANLALRKLHPFARVLRRNGVALAIPILHKIFLRVRIGPGYLNRADILQRREVYDHPLRMQRIRLARELLCQIWIAFPVAGPVAIRQPRIFVLSRVAARRTALRQLVAEGLPQKITRLGAADKISALAFRVAPRSIGIPVPRTDRQFRVLPVSDRSPSRR